MGKRAEGWVIKGAKVNMSDKVASLNKDIPLDSVRVWLMLAASVDSWGMMAGDKWTLKSELGKKDEYHGPDDYAVAVEEAIEAKLVARWWVQSNPWLYVVGHDEEAGLTRRSKNPVVERPPLEVLNRGGDIEKNTHELVKTTHELVKSCSDLDLQPPARARACGKGERGKGKGEKGNTEPPSLSPPQKSDTPNQNQLSRPGDLVDEPPPRLPDSDAGTLQPPALCNGKADGPGCDTPPVTAGVEGRTQAVVQDSRPIGMEYDELMALRQHHADQAGYQIDPRPPTGPLRTRMLEALREFGLADCKLAMTGHVNECKKPGSQRGRFYRSAFPQKGRHEHQLDETKFQEFVEIGKASPTGSPARSTHKPLERLAEDVRQDARTAGMSKVNEILGKVKGKGS